MSEMEFHRGKAREVAKDHPTFAEKIQYAKEHLNFDETLGKWDEYDIAQEYISSNAWLYFDGRLFKLENEEFDIYGECKGSLMADGSIDYLAGFYNGGCCFSEAIETCIKDAENKAQPPKDK